MRFTRWAAFIFVIVGTEPLALAGGVMTGYGGTTVGARLHRSHGGDLNFGGDWHFYRPKPQGIPNYIIRYRRVQSQIQMLHGQLQHATSGRKEIQDKLSRLCEERRAMVSRQPQLGGTR
jgi:hypothetical protein